MKKIFIIFIFSATCMFFSCEPFVEVPRERLTNENVFTSSVNTEYFLNNIYNTLPSGYNRVNIDNKSANTDKNLIAMLASATDESHHSVATATIHYFNRGTLTAVNHPDQAWAENYAGIRKTLIFSENADRAPIDAVTLSQFKGENLFLRAFFYFELVKRYGGVPLIKKVYTTEDPMSAIPRAKYQDCIAYIVELCDQAAGLLAPTVVNNLLGKATKGAALALKSRALLYAASPLYNTATPVGSDPDFIVHSAYDKNRWDVAATAAKAVIDLGESGVYALNASYSNIFLDVNNNKELILIKNATANKDVELSNFPTGYSPGLGLTCPTQSMVDAYEMANGQPIFIDDNPAMINPASGYNPAAPYLSRDSRFASSILYNGGPVLQARAVETFTGGKDMLNLTNSTKTGYYIRKFVANINIASTATASHVFPLIRFAEMYLNYAEAKNEFLDAPDASVYDAINKVRVRSLQPALVAGSLTKDEMRKRIKRERRVELAFEEHRLWDLRRWLEAETILGKPVDGMKITKTGTILTYERINVEQRLFLSPKMYFYPIPQVDVNKTGYWQNPGWE